MHCDVGLILHSGAHPHTTEGKGAVLLEHFRDLSKDRKVKATRQRGQNVSNRNHISFQQPGNPLKPLSRNNNFQNEVNTHPNNIFF